MKLLVTECMFNTTLSLQVCQLGSTCSTSYTEANDKLHSDPEAVETVTVSTNGAIDPYRFNMFMSDLLAERGSDIKQMHGTLSIQVSITQLTPYLFHIHTYSTHKLHTCIRHKLAICAPLYGTGGQICN